MPIQVVNLYYRYPSDGTWVLKGVNLEIKESLVIMGPNGSGKTTLVKHFNGLLKPVKGEVFVDGEDTRKKSVAELARVVGLVFQNPDHQLFAETVEKELWFGPRNLGLPSDEIKRRVEWALKFFGLENLRSRPPFTLSGGEKKRVALASVLTMDPKYLVLDEPTVGQDYLQKVKLASLLLELNRRGKIIVVVTHDVEFVTMLPFRVALMVNGEIVANGDVREILTNESYVNRARLTLPMVTRIAKVLRVYGVKEDALEVKELGEEIIRVLGRGEVDSCQSTRNV